MTSSIVIRRILLSTDQQLRMEQLSVVASANLVDRAGIQVHKDGAGDVFAIACFGEDGIKFAGIVEGFCRGVGATVFAEAVLEEVAGKVVSVGTLIERGDSPGMAV